VISTTIRDATYVLDEILDNETDLSILDHTTDTAGFTVILTSVGYTRIPDRGERDRLRPASLDDTLAPLLCSQRPLSTLRP
jgi:Tn3 transposase DDE domain